MEPPVTTPAVGAEDDSRVRSFERPHPNLMLYYGLLSLLLGPFFIVLLVPLFFRYKTLHYRFDDEGVSMRWGVLFRREISLTYSRIQDIHLSSNAVERHLGLARILVQTASGSAGAEMTIEGLQEYELVRDFLYRRMRGAKGLAPVPVSAQDSAEGTEVPPAPESDLAGALREVTEELRSLRSVLERRGGAGG